MDVVPPAGRVTGKRAGESRPTRKSSRQSVVEIDWRLPARLRRPVRDELERAKRARQARQAVVGFKRRPIVPLGDGRRSASNRSNVGVEHHTGDVYRDGRPFLAASPPPYAGSFLRGKTVKRQPASAQPPPRLRLASKASVGKPDIILAGERDVPYKWQAPATDAPRKAASAEKDRFALPLHFSVWPFKHKRRGADGVGAPASKKKVQSTDLLMY